MLPDICHTWTKNIQWVTGKLRGVWEAYVRSRECSTANLFLHLMMTRHEKFGVEYIVEKRVSDDLRNTELGNFRFNDLAWPCGSIEMYFEDPRLPSVLIQRRTHAEFLVEIKDLPVIPHLHNPDLKDAVFVRILVQDKDTAMQLNLSTEMIDAWAVTGGSIPTMAGGYAEFDAEESQGLHALVVLAYKVLVYASIPQLAPKPVTKNDLHYGGRPGVKGRPARPMLKVVDLPRQYRTAKETATRESKGHAFRGRHGHFHSFRAERFVNKKGSTDYWPPVLGPDGTLPKIKYRVRKPE